MATSVLLICDYQDLAEYITLYMSPSGEIYDDVWSAYHFANLI